MEGPSQPTLETFSTLTRRELVDYIMGLESQLRKLNVEWTPPQTATLSKRRKPPRRTNPFDASKYTTRHIALKFAYFGQRYNGYEHANETITPLPTIEEVLWKALRKARLISPDSDESMEVEWSPSARSKGPVDINWGGCQYSKGGRTDRGVSAFGQVIGIRVRSKRKLPAQTSTLGGVANADESCAQNENMVAQTESFDSNIATKAPEAVDFDPVKDELPYISILNSILPPDIRILAWCPDPPPDFDARFSCKERRYKYFFTNPAFTPTPGPLGLQDTRGKEMRIREGWLDIDAMRTAARKLVGLHDYRNFCKVDPSTQRTDYQRRITHADIEEVDQQAGPISFERMNALAAGIDTNGGSDVTPRANGPKVYNLSVYGSGFLWHQIRCIAAVLFLVGQGLESPAIVDELLDIGRNPNRPAYEMASDAPLVLWDCIFPAEGSGSHEEAIKWIYAGDINTLSGLTIKGDGKFGLGGVVEETWSIWRKHKMNEILASALLDLELSQGDGSALRRGGCQDISTIKQPKCQKIFDGADSARLVGKYVSVMQKPRLESVEAQNARYAAGQGARREARRIQETLRELAADEVAPAPDTIYTRRGEVQIDT